MKRLVLIKAFLFSLALFVLPLGYAATAAPEDTTYRQQVDVNEADAETLALALDGVGAEKAREIVQHREMHGEFKSVDQLMDVKGIGKATVDRNRDRILIKAK